MTLRVLGVHPYPFSRERLESMVRRLRRSGDAAEIQRECDAIEAAARATMRDLYVIEIDVSRCESHFDVGELTQSSAGDRNAQVPHGEVFLRADGVAQIDVDAVDWTGTVRIAFWLHYVDLDKPLHTPFGDVPLPLSTPLPERLLAVMAYDLP